MPDPTAPPLWRVLYCPMCGRRLRVEIARQPNGGTLPEVHRLPEHTPVGLVNLCANLVVTVSFSWDACRRCGANIGKHPSGLCRRCYGEEGHAQPE